MEEYKDIINWLKVNKNSSFSDDEFTKGLDLLRQVSSNKGIINTLSQLKINPHSRSLLRHNLDIFIRRKMDLFNVAIKKRGNFTIAPHIQGTPSVEKKETTIAADKTPISYKTLFMPDALVKLRSKSGEIFKKRGVIQAEMVNRNFGLTDISEEIRIQNEKDALEITLLTDENNTILNEVKYYAKNGVILGKHPDLIEPLKIEKEPMSLEQLNRAIRANTSYISRARKAFEKENDLLKKQRKAQRLKELEDKAIELKNALNAIQ